MDPRLSELKAKWDEVLAIASALRADGIHVLITQPLTPDTPLDANGLSLVVQMEVI